MIEQDPERVLRENVVVLFDSPADLEQKLEKTLRGAFPHRF